MVTVQGQTGLSASESEIVTSYTVSAAAADLSLCLFVFFVCVFFARRPGHTAGPITTRYGS